MGYDEWKLRSPEDDVQTTEESSYEEYLEILAELRREDVLADNSNSMGDRSHSDSHSRLDN